MNVLIVGDWHSELHEEVVYQALAKLGQAPCRFSWHQYFKPDGLLGQLGLPLLKAQYKYMVGPLVDRLNRDLVRQVEHEQPDLIFVYRGSHIYAATLRAMRSASPRVLLIGYNNDDPFSPRYPKWKWRHFLAGIPEYDLMLAYRHHNLDEFRRAGARQVELMRSWFVPDRNYPVDLSDDERARFDCDVVFVGHYEDDGRLAYLEEIVRRGWRLRIFGPGNEWDPVIRRSAFLNGQVPVQLVWGQDYNRALCGAKVALCFLSRLNRDSYTRRCFEIPASGTVLMSEFSDDLANLFLPNKEAVFFGNVSEMCARLDEVLVDDMRRRQIAAAGLERVWRDGHDVTSRMKLLLGWAEDRAGNNR